MRAYDVSGDGQADYWQHLSEGGWITTLRFDDDGDGVADVTVDREAGTSSRRTLLIILDSIPYQLVRNAHARGRFRLFHPPSAIVSPFPVMTDLCLNDFFGTAPSAGVETEYYDGVVLVDGWAPYRAAANSPWHSQVDALVPYNTHSDAYTAPDRFFDRELAMVETALASSGQSDVTAYVVSTSAIGMKLGRDGHEAALARLDRFCEALVHTARGELDITLMSDHGHCIESSKRMSLVTLLERMGYRVSDRLHEPNDVVLPKFGLVSYAAVYTRAPESVARDIIGADGVELAMYRCGSSEFMVLSRNGRALITERDGRYHYACEFGDPLLLGDIVDRLAAAGHIDSNGFIDDRALFDATADHVYPDPLRRIVRALTDEVEHTPDVLLSLSDNRCWGSPFLAMFLSAQATHGNLRRDSSTGFAMTTGAPLPPRARMADMRRTVRSENGKPANAP